MSSPQYLAAQLASQKANYNAPGLDEEARRAILHDTAAGLLNLQ